MTLRPDIPGAADLLRGRFPRMPRLALVLGSGLGGIAAEMDAPVDVAFQELPGFPDSEVEGHTGRFRCGTLDGTPLLVQEGRYHLYEGHHPATVVAPIRVLAELKVEVLILTNAAGGADPALEAGEIVLLDDHVHLQFRNPLLGPVRSGEARFPDMSAPWDPELQDRAVALAAESGLPLRRGVYASVVGPSYETPAEVRMLRSLGADVIGMSTVPEAIVAQASGIRCLGFSIVTNKGAGYSREPLSHARVVEGARVAGQRLARLLRSLVAQLPPGASTETK